MNFFSTNLCLRLCTTLVGGFFFWILYFHLPAFFFGSLILAGFAWIATIELPRLVSNNTVFWILFLCYLLPPFFLTLALYATPATRPLFFWAILIAGSHDVGAYLVGNLVGRHPLAPALSPLKTWEGALGGLGAVLTCVFLTTTNPLQYGWVALLGLSMLMSILCTAGDLFESFLKRRARVKDSGTLLPGHGGLLDRIDAFLFLVPLVYILQSSLTKLITIRVFS